MMWPPNLPKRPRGRPHMCMKIAFRMLIDGTSSMTNSDLQHENECQEMAFPRQPCDVRLWPKADITLVANRSARTNRQSLDQANAALGIISEPISVHSRAILPKQKMQAKTRWRVGGFCPCLRLSKRVGGLVREENDTEARLRKLGQGCFASQ